MMTAKRRLKTVLHRTGAFPFARSVFRKLSPAHRRERRNNRWLYGQLVKRGDLCFDIGANLGQTIEALLELGARVVAVEPNPACLPTLRYQFAGNDDVTVVSKAVGCTSGISELYFNGTESTASLRTDWLPTNEQRISVAVTTLDALMQEFGRPRFLKVDVEGFEAEVFKGLTTPVPLIYFEMFGDRFDTVSEIINALGERGEITGINVVAGDNGGWLLNQWVPPEKFLCELRPVPSRANVVVRMRC